MPNFEYDGKPRGGQLDQAIAIRSRDVPDALTTL
jgi:hypothetical protein